MSSLVNVCDTHMHFYDSRYPCAVGATLFPTDATPADYEAVRTGLGITRTVVVQPTTYGLDNQCQLDGMATLAEANGSDTVRGVAVVSAETPAADLRALHTAGMRGARFHMLPGGAVGWEQLEPVAHAIARHGWHVQLQLDGNELLDRLDALAALPVPLVIDHVGRFMPPAPPDSRAFGALLELVANGAMVKLSAPYESSVAGPPDYDDVEPLARRLIHEHPDRLLWATNWPHPGQKSPPTIADLHHLRDRWIPRGEFQQQILTTNPTNLYDFPSKDPEE